MGKTFIIAEAGVNHNGSLDLAIELINAAAGAKADAVKFQSFTADQLASKAAPKADYQKNRTGNTETQFEMLKRLEIDERAHRILLNHCKACGIQFLSSPFDIDSLNMLVRNLNLPVIKIPSGEVINAPLLLRAAQTGKKIILSTGMSNLSEIETALGVLAFGYTYSERLPGIGAFGQAYCSPEGQKLLKEKVTLLHCTTEYPAPYEEVNLRALATLKQAFGLSVGLSDHTSGIAVPIAAVAMEAAVIEKHITLDRSLPGPDHHASLEPRELKDMVDSIRQVEAAMGRSEKVPTMSELRNRQVARKSLVATKSIRKGEPFTPDNLGIKRPGTGVSPLRYWDYLGKRAEKDYSQDEVISQ